MKKYLVIFLLFTTFVYSQKERSTKVGLTSKQELEMISYDKDTTASALVLYEHGNMYVSEREDLDFKTDYYYRIKLFDRSSFDRATVKIKLYGKQKAKKIEAYSYNLDNGEIKKTELSSEEIFTKELNQNWKEVVLKSDFSISYLGNYKYKGRLVGFNKLTRNEQKVERRCVKIPGLGYGDCANIYYGMENIPEFKEEDYMLSKENFISRAIFDLVSITRTDGSKKKYTKTWEDADKSFKDDFLDGQTTMKRFFVKNLPEYLLATNNSLEKAKGIYQYVQKRFAWNGRYWTKERIKLKDAFEERKGSVDAINLSLYNSLQASNIESYIVMIATRNRGLPTRLYPVTDDFNYVIVKAVIDGKTYFLDATDEFIPFGQVPMRCLNGEGRVLDFKKGSYWEGINPTTTTATSIRVNLTIDKNASFDGDITVEKKGYHAIETRKQLKELGEDSYVSNLESSSIDFEIDDYKVVNLNDVNQSLLETIKLSSDEGLDSNSKILVNPFLYFRVSENPFKLKTRNYPVDFGYKTTYSYTASLKVPKEYKVNKIPKSVGIKLPNNGGVFLLRVGELKDGKISVNYRYQIKKRVFSTEEYRYLKEFLNNIITAHSSYVELEKI